MNTNTFLACLALVSLNSALALTGCQRQNGDPIAALDHPFRDEMVAAVIAPATEIGGSQTGYSSANLCQLAAWANYGAGVFEVVSIVGVAEYPEGRPEEIDGFTYVTLRVEDPYVLRHSAGEEIVVRLSGGPLSVSDDGLVEFTGTSVNWAVGEHVFAFLTRGEVANAGFLGTSERLTGLPLDDGTVLLLGNGVAFEVEELRRALVGAYGSFRPGEFDFVEDRSCFDVDFERCPAESRIPASVPERDNPCVDDAGTAGTDRPADDAAAFDDPGPDAR